MAVTAYKVLVVGIVQGVGFRPLVYRVAKGLGISGYVRNVGGSEVEVYVEGSKEVLDRFLNMLRRSLPPVARIEELVVEEVGVKGLEDFMILPSVGEAVKYSMIPPDFGICDDCLAEVLNPKDRRYKYYFNSCVWCGPRFSMMYKPPYDRVNTSMNDFPLCAECLEEYGDPKNVRRFHAQGMSCPKCGPRVSLYTNDGELVECEDPVEFAGKLISEGYIVGVKGLGGYHISSLATDDDVVLKLRLRKNRPQKPFAVMVLNEVIANKICYLSDDAIQILKSPERPIVLLPKREGSPISKYVSPGLDVEGLFLPYTALHYLLLNSIKDKFAIMTSGNPKDKPMCIDEECAFKHLRGYVDYFLIHNRVIVNRVDDSVLRFTDGEPVMIRRGRGYAPMWIKTRFKFKNPVIAFGAELQTAGAIAFDDKVILTQYIGDVDDYDVLSDLDKYLSWFVKIYNVDLSNAYLVVDKHPGYTSKLLAQHYLSKYGGRLIEVQHHYTHALATAADLGLDPQEEFLSVVLDGIGYGDDGNVWGGEVFKLDYSHYVRVGHLEYVPIPDAVNSIKYPARMLLSYLRKLLSSDEEVIEVLRRLGLAKAFRYSFEEAYVVLQQIRNSKIMTSSTGRFLDSISALLKICFERTYEGEPAIKLESAARGGKVKDELDGMVSEIQGRYVVLTTKILNYVLESLGSTDVRDIAYTVQYNLGRALGEVVCRLTYGSRFNHVVLGGGAVVNSIIVSGIKRSLKEYDIKIHLPKRLPPNDGGIAVGQVVSTYSFNSI
ncbi:MAG: carbamoyltransferase HypF [Sulfolobales archaeon]